MIEGDEGRGDVEAFARLLDGGLFEYRQDFIYRGMKRDIGTFGRVETHGERVAKDTSLWIVGMVERIAKGDGYIDEGYLLRSRGVAFVTPVRSIAEHYGNAYLVFFPKGEVEGINYSIRDGYGMFNALKPLFEDLSSRYNNIRKYGIPYIWDIIEKRVGIGVNVMGIMDVLGMVDGVADFEVMADEIDGIVGLLDDEGIIQRYIDTGDWSNMVDDDGGINLDEAARIIEMMRINLGGVGKIFRRMGNIIDDYFESVVVVDHNDPGFRWEYSPSEAGYDAIYEYIVKVPYYYIVNEAWFLNNFYYDSRVDGYVMRDEEEKKQYLSKIGREE